MLIQAAFGFATKTREKNSKNENMKEISLAGFFLIMLANVHFCADVFIFGNLS